MSDRPRTSLLITLITLVSLAVPALAAERYTSPTGSGGSPCNIGNPCPPNTAIGLSDPGDTVWFRGGNYDMVINWGSRSGSSGNPIVYSGYLSETANIRRNVAFNYETDPPGAHDIVFQKFTLDGSTSGTGEVGMFFWSDPAGSVHHILVQDVIVSQWPGQGIQGYHPADITLRRVYASGNGRGCSGDCDLIHGGYITGPRFIVEDSEFFNNAGYGIQIYNEFNADASDTIIRRNKFYGNVVYGGLVIGAGTGGPGLGDNIQVYNNLFYNHPNTGISVGYSCTNCKIYNNTFYNHGGVALDIGGCNGCGGASNTDVRNNIFFDNPGGSIAANANASGTSYTTNLCENAGTGCAFVGDPGFVSAAGGDFHIAFAGSQAVARGSNLSSVFMTDFAGDRRHATAPWDLGAYVFAPGATPPNFTLMAPPSVPSGQTAALTWSNVTSTGSGLTCDATVPVGGPDGPWDSTTSAALIAGGSKSSAPLTSPRTFRMTCTDSNGNTEREATTTVAAPPGVVRAFPSAEGFGRDSQGGRGGRVIKVINLDDSGTGSLRACMQNTGARTCVFEVGGTITLNSRIIVSGEAQSFLTVAGQTAPGGGIQIKNYGFSFLSGVHDIILRHLRIRPGSDANPDVTSNGFGFLAYDTFSGLPPHDIILDHISFQWHVYLGFEFSGAYNWTVQWSIIGPGMNVVDYPRAGTPGLAFGALMGSYNPYTETGTMHHNLWTGNEIRQPLVIQSDPLDYVNNIAYNWYDCSGGAQLHQANEEIFGHQVNVNLVNNIHVRGPAQPTCPPHTNLGGDGSADDPYAKVYVDGVVWPTCGTFGCAGEPLDQAGFIDFDFSPADEANHRVFTPFPAPPVTVTPLAQLETVLLGANGVGATRGLSGPARDALDGRYLNEYLNRQGGCGEQPARTACRGDVPYPTLAGGTAPTDTDGDGLPDTWEISRGLNPNNVNDGALPASNNYTNLENYLNELAGDDASLPEPTPVGLVAEYHFDEGALTTAADSSGQGHHLTLNTAGWELPGIIGPAAFSVDGTRFAETPLTPALKPSGAFGLVAWIRMTQTDVGGGFDLISAGTSYVLEIWGDDSISVFYYDGVASPTLEVLNANGLTGTNLMLAATKDATSLKLWRNTLLLGMLPLPAGSTINYGLGTNLRIGKGGNLETNRDCVGLIDEVRIFDRPLTQADIDDLFAGTPTTPVFAMTHSRWTAAHQPQGQFISALDSDLSLTFGTTAVAGLRVALHNATPGTITEYLRTFCRTTHPGPGFGAWTEVGTGFGTLGVRWLVDTAVNLGDATSPLLPLDGFTGAAGKVIADAPDVIGPVYDAAQKVTVVNGGHVEQELRLEFGAPLASGHQVQCTLYRESGALLDSYGGPGDPLVKTLTLEGVAPPTSLWIGNQQGGTRR